MLRAAVSDALHDWEFVEDATGPCGTCQVLQMDVLEILDGNDLRVPLADRAVVLTDLALGADAREGSL